MPIDVGTRERALESPEKRSEPALPGMLSVARYFLQNRFASVDMACGGEVVGLAIRALANMKRVTCEPQPVQRPRRGGV
jgi:hypothetical protein